MEDTWIRSRIIHYMFAPVLVVPDVGTVSLYLWTMSSSI
nr:NADH-plastoquinone oxidoreductase subunit 3 [Keteleeria evelyniana]QOW07136.1 NADH-plastoquinone oxidoreductase subunit 3 [Keteleeria evelyniana]QWW91979.1 NADH-plastoquinone oxidoreductase subunit 3 [Keteleeria fortunei var. cyclolepis]